jgi:hypothetical protein
MRYVETDADRAGLPDSYRREARYLGYREADHAQPYADFFTPRTRPIQEHVQRALVAGMTPPELGYPLEAAADRLAREGYDAVETGWTRLASGEIVVSTLTDMPGITAAMWDWWFGWHSAESARYKLWNPEAHQYAALGEDRTAVPGLSDRERYVANVSYVDEYIGGELLPLAIRFVDPRTLGIDDVPETTHICARVSLSTLPVAIGWLIHQVRPTDRGAEMRSRFFLNVAAVLDLPPASLAGGVGARLLARPVIRRVARPVVPTAVRRLLPVSIGTDMIFHCAAEMNHLAGFLPELYAEFRGR